MVNSERAIASLEQQASFWEERAAKMRDAVTRMRSELREAERGGRMVGLPRGPGRPPGRGTRAPRGEGVGAVTSAILKDWWRPARVNDLLPELAKRGVSVGGKRPAATLNSTLLKFAGVKRVARGLFAHADWTGDVAAAVAASPRRGPGRPPKRGPGRPPKRGPGRPPKAGRKPGRPGRKPKAGNGEGAGAPAGGGEGSTPESGQS